MLDVYNTKEVNFTLKPFMDNLVVSPSNNTVIISQSAEPPLQSENRYKTEHNAAGKEGVHRLLCTDDYCQSS